jgi:2-keto-4-pentenoate hydratase/2-oxohepta-3-ene-1,7-dioic acid hydratase in catechol pathway
MKLASIQTPNGPAPAVVLDEEIVDLEVAAPDLPASMSELLALGDRGLTRVREAIASGAGRRRLADVSLLAPVPRPPKFIGIGLNYADHVAETGKEPPQFPTVFSKLPTCVAGPYAEVQRPFVSDRLDYEGELGFVIARRCRHVPRDRAHQVIAGYLVVNDYSVRDFQTRTGQWTLGKSFDGHGVVGPWIVTGDEIEPHALPIRTIVNGEVRQQSDTGNLIFDCFTQVELLSSVFTLEPGDIVATGTPGGVGVASDRFLVPGDVVRVEVDGIGAIENRIVQEPAPAPWSER